jgi:hypothetical protein
LPVIFVSIILLLFKRKIILPLILLSLPFSSRAYINLLKPAPDFSGFVLQYPYIQNGLLSGGLSINYIDTPLTVIRISDAGYLHKGISYAFITDINLSLRVFSWMSIMIDFPYILNSDISLLNGMRSANYSTTADMLLYGKISILNEKTSLLSLSILPFLTLPTGNSDLLIGSSRIQPGITISAGRKFGRFLTALNLTYREIKKKMLDSMTMDDIIEYSLGGNEKAFIQSQFLDRRGVWNRSYKRHRCPSLVCFIEILLLSWIFRSICI